MWQEIRLFLKDYFIGEREDYDSRGRPKNKRRFLITRLAIFGGVAVILVFMWFFAVREHPLMSNLEVMQDDDQWLDVIYTNPFLRPDFDFDTIYFGSNDYEDEYVINETEED